jgi:catechol 2,3-dioxygenase-like lactoylglutathione lyase family enzyme
MEFGMFDHVQIKADDFVTSRGFYAAVLGALGYGVVFEIAGVVTGFGTSIHDMFEVRQAAADAPLSRSVHLAFTAPSEDAVRAFYAAALAQGGRDNGAPGLRPEYAPGYFAAFVIDPEGHNVEAVFCPVSPRS